jgi:hypothetical protein
MKAPALASALALALSSSALAQEAAATDAAPWLWAAPALYGFEGRVCQDSEQVGSAATMVDPLFCPALGMSQRTAIGDTFAKAVAAAFRNVEPRFGAHLPADATSAARLRGTLAVSLRLTRAARHLVAKPGGVDTYAPITLTLDITNPATGEVVFTLTRNDVAQGLQTAQDADAELLRQFPEHLNTALHALVAEAARTFRPYAQSAKVVGSVSLGNGAKGFVIDKGRNAGLRAGDGINGDGAVVHAGPDYAIVEAHLGGYREGQVLFRMASAPVEALARPTVLTVVEDAPAGYSPVWLGQILEGALGSGSALSPVPVNAAFSGLRTIALDGAGSDLPSDVRSLPDYVASVRAVLIDPATRPSEISGVSMDHHEAFVFVTLVDASGRAVGTWQGHNVIEDKVSSGIRMSLAQRRDAVLRNALEDAAKAMATFRPQPRLVALLGKGGTMTMADGGASGMGQTLPVLRPAGRFSGISGPVMVPVGVVTTGAPAATGMAVTDAGALPLSLVGGEVVALEASGLPATMRQSVGQCLDDAGLPAIDDRGQIKMSGYAAAAPALLAGRMAAPVRLTSLPGLLQAYAPSFAGWAGYGAAAHKSVDACFVPVVSVVPVAAGYNVTVGYTLHRGARASDPKIGSSGLATTLTPTRLPSGTEAAAQAAMLQSDLALQALPLTGNAAAALKPAS